MNARSAHIGVAPLAWLQHNAPWLGFFALVMGLFIYDADDAAYDPDDRNG